VDLDTGAMMLEARNVAVRRGLGPLHRHRRELRFFRFGISSAFCLAMAEPGRRTSRRVFFTGCSLPATGPDLTFRLYHELRRRYPGTGLLMHCCGSPAEAMGMADEARAARLGVAAAVERLGAEELVVACPRCRDSLATGEVGVTIRSIWSLLADELEGSEHRHGWKVSVHDPCAARGDGEVRSAVRRLVASTGAELNDVEWSGVRSRCCGLGGRIVDVDPRLSRAMARRRAAEVEGPVVTYCSRCQLALSGAGANVVHVAEFLFADPAETAPGRVARGSLRRYVNRLLVKRRFLRLAAVGSDGWS
jgi:Fe-S oxidoreductase